MTKAFNDFHLIADRQLVDGAFRQSVKDVSVFLAQLDSGIVGGAVSTALLVAPFRADLAASTPRRHQVQA